MLGQKRLEDRISAKALLFVSTWRIALYPYVYKSVVVLFVVTVLKK